jgi:hypothetical protein
MVAIACFVYGDHVRHKFVLKKVQEYHDVIRKTAIHDQEAILAAKKSLLKKAVRNRSKLDEKTLYRRQLDGARKLKGFY